MRTQGCKIASLALIVLLLSVFVFIDLFHTDSGALKDNTCPVCHYQNSSTAIAQDIFIELPELVLLEILDAIFSSEYETFSTRLVTARSPPQI